MNILLLDAAQLVNVQNSSLSLFSVFLFEILVIGVEQFRELKLGIRLKDAFRVLLRPPFEKVTLK